MSADIIQFISRPRNDHEQTDFPTIAFRSVVHDLATDQVDTAPSEYVEPERGETQMPKALTSLRSLARSHARTAITLLARIMRSEDATPAARVSAANAILDHGWGKATQPLESSYNGTLELYRSMESCASLSTLKIPTAKFFEPLPARCKGVHGRRGSGQLLVFDKVLGLGPTDPLAAFAAITSNLVISFYFVKRSFENIARIIKR
jgi:hypothetical protein